VRAYLGRHTFATFDARDPQPFLARMRERVAPEDASVTPAAAVRQV
jgi:hypothetical protein